jgi:hypothetical protein
MNGRWHGCVPGAFSLGSTGSRRCRRRIGIIARQTSNAYRIALASIGAAMFSRGSERNYRQPSRSIGAQVIT